MMFINRIVHEVINLSGPLSVVRTKEVTEEFPAEILRKILGYALLNEGPREVIIKQADVLTINLIGKATPAVMLVNKHFFNSCMSLGLIKCAFKTASNNVMYINPAIDTFDLFHIKDEKAFSKALLDMSSLKAIRNLKMDLDLFEYAGLHPEVLDGAVQLKNLSLAGDGAARDPDGPCRLRFIIKRATKKGAKKVARACYFDKVAGHQLEGRKAIKFMTKDFQNEVEVDRLFKLTTMVNDLMVNEGSMLAEVNVDIFYQ